MQLAYALLVSLEVFNFVREIQLEIHERFGSNPELGRPPHITLKLPFEAPADLHLFEGHLDALAADTESFEVAVRGFGTFKEGILFLDVVQDARLVALQRRILNELAPHGVRPTEVEGSRFRFHCTVASGLDPERLAAVRDRFATRTVESRFPAKTLCLFARLDSGDWIIARKATLSGVRWDAVR